MLVREIKAGRGIKIGPDITVIVTRIRGQAVHLAIDAPGREVGHLPKEPPVEKPGG